MLGSLLTQWTIRLALACLAIYWAGNLWQWRLAIGRSTDNRKTRAADRRFVLFRWIWTVGCLLFVAHVACAFHFTHGWSHDHAWRHTEAETQRLMGFSFGDGIYFSYLFLLLWVGDVVLLWLNVARPTWLVVGVYLFLFFIAFNGAIVFEDGPTRPVGMAVVVGLAALFAVAAWKRTFWMRSSGRQVTSPVSNSRAEAEA